MSDRCCFTEQKTNIIYKNTGKEIGVNGLLLDAYFFLIYTHRDIDPEIDEKEICI